MMQDLITRFANGEFLIVTDDEGRENEGDLMILAGQVTPEKVAFMVRHTTGILCVAITQDRARNLQLPLMVDSNQDPKKTAFTVSVDAKEGVRTGVSAQERSITVRALAHSDTKPADFTRPGHIFPLIAHPQGLFVRQGHTEAGIALAQLAKATPATLLAEIVNDDGTMTRGSELQKFATTHSIPIISIAALRQYLIENEILPKEDLQTISYLWAVLPTRHGDWEIASFAGLSQREHAVIKFGLTEIKPMVRIHSECFTGDILYSQRCDCGEQLEESMRQIRRHGHGYIIYLRNHEGRGIGLGEKIKAYQLQDQGMDTVDANTSLGHPIDARNWSDAIEMIRSLGLTSLTLLTNNPDKVAAVQSLGVICEQQSLQVEGNSFNKKYLTTKAERLGHLSVLELVTNQKER